MEGITQTAQLIILLMFIFGLLVSIHELGHFLAAKYFGVWVEEFAIGFGPKLVAFQYHDTIYKLNAIPLGGYVKLYGESALQDPQSLKRKFEESDASTQDKIKKLAEEMKLAGIRDENELTTLLLDNKSIDDTDKDLLWMYEISKEERINDTTRYSNKPVWNRLVIVCAGVIMNFILAVIIFAIYLGAFVNWKTFVPQIGEHNFLGAETSAIDSFVIINTYQKDIEVLNGTAIIAVNDQKITSPDVYTSILAENVDKEVKVEYYVLNKGEIRTTNLILDKSDQIDTSIDTAINGKIMVSEVKPGSAAERAQLKPGDVVLTLNGLEIQTQEALKNEIQRQKDQIITLGVLRNKEGLIEIKADLKGTEQDGSPMLGIGYGAIDTQMFYNITGYYLDYSQSKGLAPLQHTINMATYQFTAIGEIIKSSIATGDTDQLVNGVSGPIMVGAVVNELVKFKSINDIVSLIALISLTLAIMNILPLPLVDGGHVVLLIIEKLRGRPLSSRSMQIFNLVGIVFFVSLTLIITLKDIWIVFIRGI